MSIAHAAERRRVQEICNSVYREREVAGMDKEKRFCPFKSSMQVDYRNGAKECAQFVL